MPSLEEEIWLRKALALGREADIEEGAALLAACPGSFRASPDFGCYAGLYFGRAIALRERNPGLLSEETIDLLCAAVSACTLWPPATMASLLAGLDARVLSALLRAWPRSLRGRRPFFIGVHLGLFMEGHPGTERIDDRELDRVIALLYSHRRPDAGALSLI